jgi:hypothetical protein
MSRFARFSLAQQQTARFGAPKWLFEKEFAKFAPIRSAFWLAVRRQRLL